MKENKVNLSFISIISFFYSLSAIMTLSPYFGWHFKYFVLLAPMLALLAFILSVSIYGFKLDRKNLYLFIFALFISIYLNLSDIRTVMVNLVFYIPLLLFIIENRSIKLSSFKIFTKLFAISLIPGLLLYLFHSLGLDLSWKYLEPSNPVKILNSYYYKQYFGAAVLSNFNFDIGFPYRLSAIYDEPGVVGTISALILTSTGFKIKKPVY